MRDPVRIRRVLLSLAAIWHANPEQRLGQLMVNLTRGVDGSANIDRLWNIEEPEFLELLEAAERRGHA